ncbi:primosomal replication protein PriC [Pasteurellaceae bacterium 22721_9_1]
MKNYTALFDELERHIAALQQQYSAYQDKSLTTTFAEHVFSENGLSLNDYIAEMRQGVQQLRQLSAPTSEEITFYCDRLIAQFRSLQDAMIEISQSKSKKAINFKSTMNNREKLRQSIDQLPPRERLDKYYEALHALNEKLNQQKSMLTLATNDWDKQAISAQIEHTKQRQIRCLNAIETLEEYLAFKDEQI